jgi:hypothetical protein
MIVVGWTDTYIASCPIADFSEVRKKALIERIRKRKYNFNFADYQFLSYCCPMYEDGKICVLNKQQFDDVMNEAWKDIPRTKRLMPIDVISIQPVNGVLYEKEKFIPKDGENNG